MILIFPPKISPTISEQQVLGPYHKKVDSDLLNGQNKVNTGGEKPNAYQKKALIDADLIGGGSMYCFCVV